MAASRRTIRVGLIAEDDSDVDVIHVLLRKITPRRSFCIRPFVGHGCGKLRYKGRVWAAQLADRGCSALVFVHDLDRQNLAALKKALEAILAPSPIRRYIIIIPIEELEAWLLADSNALKRSFNLKKKLKSVANPEVIANPKRFLQNLIWINSGKTKRYINTVHNVRIAEHIEISALRKCKAFRPLEKFWTDLKVA